MDRKDFIRNSAGALAALFVGSKLEFLPVPDNPDEIEAILYLPKGQVKAGDLIKSNDGEIYIATFVNRTGKLGEGEISNINKCLKIKFKETEYKSKANAAIISSLIGEFS
jgi:hypothetical protein